MMEICKFTVYFDELTAALEENGMEYSVQECLGRCDLCHSTAFVKKGEEYISAENVEQLMDKLMN